MKLLLARLDKCPVENTMYPVQRIADSVPIVIREEKQEIVSCLTRFFQNSVPVQVQGSITPEEIALYTHCWQDPAHLHASISYFSSFQTDAEEIKNTNGKEKLQMPVLALGADHSLGMAVLTQVENYATNVTGGVIVNAGHWIPEEHPQALVAQLLTFFHKKEQAKKRKGNIYGYEHFITGSQRR